MTRNVPFQASAISGEVTGFFFSFFLNKAEMEKVLKDRPKEGSPTLMSVHKAAFPYLPDAPSRRGFFSPLVAYDL